MIVEWLPMQSERRDISLVSLSLSSSLSSSLSVPPPSGRFASPATSVHKRLTHSPKYPHLYACPVLPWFSSCHHNLATFCVTIGFSRAFSFASFSISSQNDWPVWIPNIECPVQGDSRFKAPSVTRAPAREGTSMDSPARARGHASMDSTARERLHPSRDESQLNVLLSSNFVFLGARPPVLKVKETHGNLKKTPP